MGRAAICCAAAALIAAGAAVAQTQSYAGEIHDLELGLQAQTMTLDGWGQLACGSDGGPPRQDIDIWSQFKKCQPEANGLHEVAARFDDEDEYVGKALGEPAYAAHRTGTRVAGHPVVLSALFDDGGALRGIRMVSDPRATPTERRMAHLLGVAVINRYGTDNWTCADLPPAEGESAVDIPAERHELYRLNRAVKRPQRPEDLVGLIAFLVGPESGYITGQTFAVNGGFTMH